MSSSPLSPEVNAALHKLVFSKYARGTGIGEHKFEISIDPSMANELSIKVDYETNKLIITTRYVPIGDLADKFDRCMKNLFVNVIPRFVYNTDGGIEKYNQAFYSVAFTGIVSANKKKEKFGKFKITSLIGVRVVDQETGVVVEHFASYSAGETLQSIRDKVIAHMYRDTGE